MVIFEARKVARKLSIRRRFQSLTSSEQVLCRQIEKTVTRIVSMLENPDLKQLKRKKIKMFGRFLLLCYGSIIYRPMNQPEAVERKNISFATFCEADCRVFFTFLKNDLPRLFIALQIPEKISLANGASMNGEELLLRSLFELVSGSDQYEIAHIFGGDQPLQSRALHWFIDHVFTTFHDLLSDNLAWWDQSGYLEKSRDAIKNKLEWDTWCQDEFETGLFIDCNCMETSTPGGGPAAEGPGAQRWDRKIQEAFYNGWKSIHGLKHQTVDCAFGMTVDLFGPWSLRKNDCRLLSQSQINRRLRELQADRPNQIKIFGDSAYPTMSHLRSYISHPNLTEEEKLWNHKFKSVRISIEWNYMITASLFKYIITSSKLRLMASSNVAKVYTVVTLLRNCHVALYGSETSNYFDVVMPVNMLEQYMRVQ
jgi:hypothetical protein